MPKCGSALRTLARDLIFNQIDKGSQGNWVERLDVLATSWDLPYYDPPYVLHQSKKIVNEKVHKMSEFIRSSDKTIRR